MPVELTRILYVEDEPDIQAIARIALESVGGFELRICSSGDEALEQASDFLPDLFLLDVMMPNMDGPTTLAELRKQHQFKSTPAIFMTAKVKAREVDDLMQNGAVDVIAKPFDPMKLPEQLRTIWATL